MGYPARYLAALAAPLLASALLSACAPPPPPDPAQGSGRATLERSLARAASKGEWEKAFRLCDSALAKGDAADREVASYWKAVAWLFRDEPDSALAILESRQGKWSAGARKVHGMLLLKLVRESKAARVPARVRPEEADPRPVPGERALQDRVEALEKESSGLRAENQRLETEKEKYQKLLKDLETIR